MRQLLLCLALGLSSLQLTASNAVPALPEVGLELSVLLNDISIISSEVEELVFTRCCTARGGGNSVRVCREDNNKELACAQAQIGLEKIQ
jgi:hypothetical protein